MHSVNLKNNVHLKCNKLIDHEFIIFSIDSAALCLIDNKEVYKTLTRNKKPSNDKTHNFTANFILKLTSVSSCNANTYILQQTIYLIKFS